MPISSREKAAWETSLHDAKTSPDSFNRLNKLMNEFYDKHKNLMRYDPWSMMFHRRIIESLEGLKNVHT